MNIENGYYYIENGVIKKEDGYTDSFQEVGRVSNIHFEKEIRNKTIDEFIDKLLGWKPKDEEYRNLSDVCSEIANQMKEGDINE